MGDDKDSGVTLDSEGMLTITVIPGKPLNVLCPALITLWLGGEKVAQVDATFHFDKVPEPFKRRAVEAISLVKGVSLGMHPAMVIGAMQEAPSLTPEEGALLDRAWKEYHRRGRAMNTTPPPPKPSWIKRFLHALSRRG